MFNCNCGKTYKTETGYNKHISNCKYVDLDPDKVYRLGKLISEYNKFLFRAPLGKIRKVAKDENVSEDIAKDIVLKQVILKYKKSLWDILLVWREALLVSEYRVFIKWVFSTYKDINLLSLRSTLTNPKIIYRYNIEHTVDMITGRIEDSLLFLHNKKEFSNDFEFINHIIIGDISMYYVIFNDWLAEEWFSHLDTDLQKELEDLVEIATKTVLERINCDDFDILQKLACSETPKIHRMI